MPSKDFDSRHDFQIPPTDWYQSFAAAGLRNPEIHGALSYWLTLDGSLTRALQLRCETGLSVRVLREGFARPTREERRSLALPVRQVAWIREVCLVGDGTPWVLARTIIPLSTLSGRGRRLRHLGRQPLGAYLFSQSEWQRGGFETGLCAQQTPDQPVAGRRSRFHSGDRALLVGEYFLPDLTHAYS